MATMLKACLGALLVALAVPAWAEPVFVVDIVALDARGPDVADDVAAKVTWEDGTQLRLFKALGDGRTIVNHGSTRIGLVVDAGGHRRLVLEPGQRMEISLDALRATMATPGWLDRVLALMTDTLTTAEVESFTRSTNIAAPLLDGMPLPMIPVDLGGLSLRWENGVPPFRVTVVNGTTTVVDARVDERELHVDLPVLAPPALFVTIEDATGLRRPYALQVAPAAPDVADAAPAGVDDVSRRLAEAWTLLDRDAGAWRVLAVERLRHAAESSRLADALATALLEGEVRATR